MALVPKLDMETWMWPLEHQLEGINAFLLPLAVLWLRQPSLQLAFTATGKQHCLTSPFELPGPFFFFCRADDFSKSRSPPTNPCDKGEQGLLLERVEGGEREERGTHPHAEGQ